ncbi:carboxylate/amino acid/amine transporter [Anaerohalosphaera lusitana]|uniref:Carboxylate/amino acid/amine transporter n=1 Tax=Anaerohalosphaera lusitana TaxID=1936003 RepID=A0A1U9NJ17_9BACT|nr:EamA family transporter [Anaerohalosphaera lusitana]AQT67815.1 carboxylate/amino acid/amine transporter [Anaerohalosphaera lusitana]
MTGHVEKERAKGVGLLVATALLWSLGGVLVKSIEWNGMAIGGMRSAIGAVVLAFFMKREWLTFSRVQLAGAVCYIGAVLLYAVANKLTTAANVILLQYTAPIYVALLSGWFLGEKIRLYNWIAIAAAIGGMVLFFVGEVSAEGLWGNVLGVATGLSFGMMMLVMRKQRMEAAMGSIFLGNVFTAVLGLPFMFESMPGAVSWVNLVLLGVVQLGIPYVLYARGISRVKAIDAVMICTLEPILNPVWVLIFVGEVPGEWALAGGVVVLVAVTSNAVEATLRNGKARREKAAG